MAKSTVTYICGHFETIVGRNRAEADRKAKWLTEKGTNCRDCAYAATVAAAHEAGQANGWPALQGQSAKQIDYAAVKRAEALKALPAVHQGITDVADKWHDLLSAKIAGDLPDLYRLAVYDAGSAIVHHAPNEVDARFWLDQDLDNRVAQQMHETLASQAIAMAAEGLIDSLTRDRWVRYFSRLELVSLLRSVQQ